MQYLQNLYEEVKQDSVELEQVVDFYQKKEKKLDELIGLLDAQNVSDSTLQLIMLTIFNNNFFSSNIYTWDAVKEGGELAIIHSFQMKILMSELQKNILLWKSMRNR